MQNRFSVEVKLPGIKLLKKENYPCLNYIINRLLEPEIKKHLFDDYMGIHEITALLYSVNTIVYGIFHKGLPEPLGSVFFTGVVPFRDCYLYGAVFDRENRNQGKITEVYERIKKDITERFFISSVTANVIGKNLVSVKILEKIGLKKIGVKPKAIMVEGKKKDLTIYYILGEEA